MARLLCDQCGKVFRSSTGLQWHLLHVHGQNPAATEPMSDETLVLVENEATTEGKYDFWRDITGVQYQYPNTYKGRIRSGVPFLYYRGALRKSGVPGRIEYFGHGVIGKVWRDPETSGPKQRWYASIEDYVPFAVPIPARRSDGTTYEVPPGKSGHRYFGIGVRRIPNEVYEEILSAAGLTPLSTS